MTQNEIIGVFAQLGDSLQNVVKQQPVSDWEHKCLAAIQKEHIYNGWFTLSSVIEAMDGIQHWLNSSELSGWVSHYAFTDKPKSIGLIMAGNLPLVGFHDFLAVLVTGNCAIVKLSKDDSRLFPILIERLIDLAPELVDRIRITPQLKGFDAVIATGSDNSARYFEQYFGKVPHIIRRNRTSVAVLDGSETSKELKDLGKDIFSFFGLGCRNVSKILIPQDFDLDRFFGSIMDYGDMIHHHKYANNYDYHRTIFLMNQDQIIENGFVLLMETDALHSPLAVLYYQRYSDKKEVQDFLHINRDKIQVVVGREYEVFGKAQKPSLSDYADNVNTLEFLSNLKISQ